MLNIDKVKVEINELVQKYDLLLVVLIGSQVSGKTHFASDVDLAFISAKKLSLLEIAKMQLAFTEKLKISKIELVDLKQASPLFLQSALKQTIILYEKEQNFFDLFKIFTQKMFMESKKLLELRSLSLNRFLKNI